MTGTYQRVDSQGEEEDVPDEQHDVAVTQPASSPPVSPEHPSGTLDDQPTNTTRSMFVVCFNILFR